MPMTSPFSGRRMDVGISKPGSRGATAASVDYWLPHAAYTFQRKVAKVRDDSGLSTIESPRSADIVKQWTEGDVEFNIRDQSIGLILLALLGAESFAINTPQSGVGQHTFTVAQSNQHQDLAIWKKNPVETLQAGNVMITTFALKAVLNQYVRATIGLMGKLFGNDTASVSYTSENRFRPQDVTIKLADTNSALGSASALTTVRSLNLNIAKNIEEYQGLGAADPVDFVNKTLDVTGDFEIAFENATYENYTLLNQFKAISIKLANLGAIVGASTNPSMEIILDEVDFDNFDLKEELENVTILTAHFKGHYNTANSRMIRAILINSKNSAY